MSAFSAHPISKSLQEYDRGIAGGLIFSLPLLYTMEVWQAGSAMQPERLLFARLAHGEEAEGRAIFPAQPGVGAATARVVSYITP